MSSSDSPAVELVITAPAADASALAYHARCRLTLPVLTQLVAESRRQVVIAAPFLQQGYGLTGGPLAHALKAALRRGVAVDLATTGTSLQTIDLESVRAFYPHQLRLYRARANVDNDSRLGLHAKFCVADGERAYVGSANLTGPGLSEHLEMGLLVRGEVARQIADFWSYTVESGLFVRTDRLDRNA